MKHNIYSWALLLLLLFLITTSQTNLLAFKQGEKEANLNEITTGVSLEENKGTDSLDKLMGLAEDCQSGGEECLDRRMVAEAHLDYIYTQHHMP